MPGAPTTGRRRSSHVGKRNFCITSHRPIGSFGSTRAAESLEVDMGVVRHIDSHNRREVRNLTISMTMEHFGTLGMLEVCTRKSNHERGHSLRFPELENVFDFSHQLERKVKHQQTLTHVLTYEMGISYRRLSWHQLEVLRIFVPTVLDDVFTTFSIVRTKLGLCSFGDFV